LSVYLQRSTQLTVTRFSDHFSSEMTTFYQVRSTQLICSLLRKKIHSELVDDLP